MRNTLLAFTLPMAAAAAFGQPSLTAIPVLPGYEQTRAHAVSGDGLTVAGDCGFSTSTLAPTNPVPILWSLADGTRVVPGSAGQPSPIGYAYAINGDGTHAAGRLGQNNIYRWNAGGLLSLPTVPGTTMGIALGISADGSAVVGHSLNSPTKPYRWTAATGTVVLQGGDTGGTARAVSADGSVVAGGLLQTSVTYATRWTGLDSGGGGGAAHMFHLHGASYGITPDGSVVVGHVTVPGGVGRAHRWTFTAPFDPPAALDLGTVPGDDYSLRRSTAHAVNADGTVVVGTARRAPATLGVYPDTAFLWRDGQEMVDLNVYAASIGLDMTGWDLRSANGVSADGRVIVGHATLNGVPRGFVLRLGDANPCGTADFDGDGDSATDADIEAFFACLAGTCCPTCWHLGADFNADGDAATDADIEAFFRVLAGQDC